MGGVATVVVLPEHRGEGIAARLLERVTRTRCASAGSSSARCNPATTRVYRVGGVGDRWRPRDPPDPDPLARAAAAGRLREVRRLTRDDWPLVQACYDAVAAVALGLGRPQRVVVGRAGGRRRSSTRPSSTASTATTGSRGYVVFAQEQTDRGWGYTIVVEEMVAREPGAAVTLWRFLGDARHAGRDDHPAARARSTSCCWSCPSRTSSRCATTGGCTASSTRRPRSRRVASRRDVAAEVHLELTRPARAVERRPLGAAGRRRARRAGVRRDRRAPAHDQRVQRAGDRLGVCDRADAARVRCTTRPPPTAPRSTPSSPAPPPRWSTSSDPIPRFGVSHPVPLRAA